MVRIGLGELFELDERKLPARELLTLGLANAFHLETEGDVSQRRAPWEQLGEVLEHHAAVEPMAGDGPTANADLAAGGGEKAGDDIEQARLAAAGRADNTEKFRRLDAEAYVLDRGDPAGGRVVDERDVCSFDMWHDLLPLFRRSPRRLHHAPAHHRGVLDRAEHQALEDETDQSDHGEGRRASRQR